MSKIFLLLSIFQASVSFCQGKSGPAISTQKLGYILYDSVLVHVNNYPTQIKLNEAYQKQLNAEYEMKKLELETKLKEFGDKQATLSEEQKKAKQQELQKMDGELQSFAQEAQKKLAKKELVAPLNEKIAKAIEAVAAKHGYTHIADKKNFYYVSSAFDVTKLVVEEANK